MAEQEDTGSNQIDPTPQVLNVSNVSKSSREYRLRRAVRIGTPCAAEAAPDTAFPRYGTKTSKTHRRTEYRMEKWIPHG